MLATGAGAESSSLGLVVFGGLLVATFLSGVVPVFYVVMKSLLGRRRVGMSQPSRHPLHDPDGSSAKI